MRDELAKLHGARRRFQGIFVRFGMKSGYKGPLTTILLKNIVDVASNKLVADHLWFTMGKQFEGLDLKEGDVVRFNARVTEYEKGYKGRQDEDDYDYKPVERDFRLSFPTQFMKMPKPATTTSQLFLLGEIIASSRMVKLHSNIPTTSTSPLRP